MAASDSELTDDDGDTPLFAAGNLRPGERVTGCVRVTHGGSKEAPVTLSGQGSGPLDEFLDLEIEQGSGGGNGDCAGFSGTTLFDGTLAEFLQPADGSNGELPAWTASDAARARTFRISVSLRDAAAAQGQTASASFEWQAPAEGEPPPRDSDPAPPASPAPAPTAHPQAATEPDPRKSPAQRPDPVRSGPESRPPTKSPPATGKDKTLLDAVGKVASETGKRIAVPSILGLLALLFMFAQNRLDRKDPKLALAPVHRDEKLRFGPLPWAEAGR